MNMFAAKKIILAFLLAGSALSADGPNYSLMVIWTKHPTKVFD
jgi:hypothetical protein